MKIGVLGTGMVGQAIASKLAALGHQVMMGSRTANNDKAQAWARKIGSRGQVGTFADAAAFGEVVFNCTHGAASLDALRAAGAESVDGKILVDVANVLPPADAGSESLGQQIQTAFPRTKVVKTLNTINCEVMVDPQRVPGTHTLFLSGNDADAKTIVRGLVESFGWRDVIDLGDITTARAAERYVTLWVSLWRSLGTADFNIQVVR
jgi:8-hydroxy-5-deazaflavin:NADPH oxidoreductase